MASMVRGGGETFDLEMARRLAGLGCEVTLLTGLPLFGRARLRPKDWWHGGEIRNSKFEIRTCSVRTPYFGWFPWDRVRGGWRLRVADFKMFEWAAARWAFRRREQYDVVQVCELPFFVGYFKAREARLGASAAGGARRLPVVMRLTAPDFHDPRGALRLADAVIASGTTMGRVRAGLRPDCVDVPNGVDIEHFRPGAPSARASLGLATDDLVILFVARFQAVKNHRMLVDAFARVAASEPRARLVLVGSGPLEADARGRCSAAGLAANVVFAGEVPFDRMPGIYAAADVNVIASDYESFSFAALEGMACGLPHVVTATDWVPGLLGGGPSGGEAPGGIVVPVGDAGAFAQALLRLLGDRAARARMGAWNRDRAARDFGWGASAARLRDLYESLRSV